MAAHFLPHRNMVFCRTKAFWLLFKVVNHLTGAQLLLLPQVSQDLVIPIDIEKSHLSTMP